MSSRKRLSSRGAGLAAARAVVACVRPRSRGAWTIVEYSGADWTHGYCTGDRLAAWRFNGASATRLPSPPSFLRVPCAQFCLHAGKILVEVSVREGTGEGRIWGIERSGRAFRLVEREDGLKWRSAR